MKKSILCVLLVGVPGVIAAGCSGGSSGGGFSPGPVGSVGAVTSDLPATDLNASGYDFASVAASTSLAGNVAALSAAPVGTASLVAFTPLNEAELLANGSLSPEEAFAAPPSSIARLQSDTDMFVGTGDRAVNGAGDIYRREDNAGAGLWSVVLDTDRSEAYVAAVGTSLLALAGGPDQLGEVYEWDSTAQIFTSIAALGSITPTAAAAHEGLVYVGGTVSDAAGGPAKLLRLSSGALEEIALPGPLAQAGMNYRQEITAMLTVSNATQGETLFLAIGTYDLISGAALGGTLLATNGTDFERLLDFVQDAPSSLAFHDGAIYAGSRAGRLIHREDSGAWLDEPGLPVAEEISALLSLTGDTLLIGTGSSTGPAVLIRTELAPTPGSNPTPGTSPSPTPGMPPAGNLSYVTDVAPVMVTCTTCHKSNGRVGGKMVMTNPSDPSADYQTVLGYVDLGTPVDSALLVAPQGASHPTIIGGAGDPTYDTLLLWVQQGALP